MGTLDSVYARLPLWGQHCAVSAYGLYWKHVRFGRGFRAFLERYLEREQYSDEDWRHYQQDQLHTLIRMAYSSVPYYKSRWSEPQYREAISGNLQALPLLEKQPVRENPHSFVRRDVKPRRLLTFHTSGTSGTPITTLWVSSEMRDALAIREARSAKWAGVSFSVPRATFSGRIVEPNPFSDGPFYRYNMAERQVYLSAFHLRPDTADQYVKAIRKKNVRWLTGYAVSYYLLAKFILERNIPVPPLQAVITTSEKVTPAMREVMETAYRCRVFEEYSTVENSLFVSQCEQGRLHVSPDAGIVEILRSDGSPCDPGEIGEVVATSFIRVTQPFIRYRLGDLAAWDARKCPCGRSMPVVKEVTGRIEDVIVGPDGRHMVRFHGIFVDQPHVQEGQIIQSAVDKITVKVVPSDGFGAGDVAEIVRRIQQRLTPEVQVTVDTVDAIPRTSGGKFQAVVSMIRKQN